MPEPQALLCTTRFYAAVLRCSGACSGVARLLRSAFTGSPPRTQPMCGWPKFGLDVAIEVRRDYLHTRRGSIDEPWCYAAVCRVTNVMRSYLEGLSA